MVICTLGSLTGSGSCIVEVSVCTAKVTVDVFQSIEAPYQIVPVLLQYYYMGLRGSCALV